MKLYGDTALLLLENLNGRISEDDMVKLGGIVSGVVEGLTPSAVVINVNSKAHLKGMISNEHLADHHGMLFIASIEFSFCTFLCWLFLRFCLVLQNVLPC